MAKTLVSILLPVYQAASTLETCLRSLQRQSETRWACIAVEDGSRDKSLQILSEVAKRDSRIQIVRKKHGGIVSALRTGLPYCRAPWIARMDADDWMHRDRLALQIDALRQNTRLSAVGSHVRVFPRRLMTEGARRYESWLNHIEDARAMSTERWIECPVAHPTLMFRAETLREFGYQDRGWPEDYDLVLRLLGSGHEIGVVPRKLLGWRDSDARLSRTSPHYERDQFVRCKAFHLSQTFLSSTRRYALWGYGSTGRALRRALETYERQPSHIVDVHPRRMGQKVHGAEVVNYKRLSQIRPERLIVSVAGDAPRRQIRAALDQMGFRQSIDYVCAA